MPYTNNALGLCLLHWKKDDNIAQSFLAEFDLLGKDFSSGVDRRRQKRGAQEGVLNDEG